MASDRDTDPENGGRGLRDRLRAFGQRVPPGLRAALGLVFVAGGIVGFLPVVGFWMIPVGLFLVALDVAPVWRALWAGRGGGSGPSSKGDRK